MTCILLNEKSQYGKALYDMDPISGYFEKGRTIEILKTPVVTRELALKRSMIKRYIHWILGHCNILHYL